MGGQNLRTPTLKVGNNYINEISNTIQYMTGHNNYSCDCGFLLLKILLYSSSMVRHAPNLVILIHLGRD